MIATRWNLANRFCWGLAIVLGIALAGSSTAALENNQAQQRRLAKEKPTTTAAVDYFLKIEGIPGESTDDKHKGEIDILSWSWGEGSQSRAAAGGPGVIKITKPVDKASPGLSQAATRRQHIPEATLTVRKAGSDPAQYMEIKMHNVMVSSYQRSGDADDRPTESISFNYAKIEMRDLPPRRLVTRP